MLRYINNGKVNDSATETIDKEIHEARLKEEWKSEYMLTLVHDNDVYVDGFDAGFDDGFDKGAFKTTLEIIKNAISSTYKSFDEVCDMLNIQDREKYRSLLENS